MDILVGDLAKLYGISSQTLHYYEQKKIINPKRDVLTGYRYFETADLPRLGAIKKHRNANFTLNKALELYDHACQSKIIDEYTKQKIKIQEEIEKSIVLMNRFEEILSLYEAYKERGQSISIEELEGFLRFESSEGEIIVQGEEIREEAIAWFSNIFYTSGSEMFYIDEDSKEIYNSTRGMLATLDIAKFLKLKNTENIKKIDKGKFLTSFIDTDIEEDYKKVVYDCLDYIKDNDLELRGMPFTRTMLVFKNENDEREVIEQVLVPIK